MGKRVYVFCVCVCALLGPDGNIIGAQKPTTVLKYATEQPSSARALGGFKNWNRQLWALILLWCESIFAKGTWNLTRVLYLLRSSLQPPFQVTCWFRGV